MNRHTIKQHRVGNSGSKYDLNPNALDDDIADKQAVAHTASEAITAALESFLHADYRYSDNMPMSLGQRWSIIIYVLSEIKEKYDL